VTTGQPVDPRSQVSPRRPGGNRAPRPRRGIGLPRVTPTRIFLFVALAGSLAYLAWAITVRDPSQLPMLAAGAAVLGLVFTAIALAGAIEVVRAGRRGEGGRSFAAALFGGIAGIIALGCFAAATVFAILS